MYEICFALFMLDVQVVLIRDLIRQIKVDFNKIHHDVWADKQSASEKIRAKAAEIRKVDS